MVTLIGSCFNNLKTYLLHVESKGSTEVILRAFLISFYYIGKALSLLFNVWIRAYATFNKGLNNV